jgi:pimeloyl-ACP methyl ester carboxylesterase
MFDYNSISKKHNLLSIDFPGHGFTPGPALTSIEAQTDFCIKLLKKLNIGHPIVAGHSMGGLVALKLSLLIAVKQTILINTSYPLAVGELLLDHAKGNLDQASEFFTKYGVFNIPEAEIKSKGFGVMGSGFYGRSKGTIKSPYGTKNIESDPEKEIRLYPLKKIFNQTYKEILSIDLKACSPFRITEDEINNLSKIHFIYGGKDKLARFNPECDLLKNIDIDKKVHIMPETGHFPFFERPVEFNSLIRKVINL